MSWDIFVQDFPADAMSLEEIPTDFKPASLGKRAGIIEQIRMVIPSANFADLSWGTIDSDGWSIEINIGPEDDCSGFAFHVRGGDAAIGVIAAILQQLKLRAVDSQTGDFFVADGTAVDAFHKWRAYRDQVVNSNENQAWPLKGLPYK